MKRRLNSTGRRKIKPEHVSIRLIRNDDGLDRFEASLSGLAALGLAEDARIVVEAYVKTSSMRFECGTIGALQVPATTELLELDRGASVLFRVKVIDVGAIPGRLLASSGTLHPQDQSDDEDDRKALLPLREVDLGQEIWRLDMEGKPFLLINRAVPDLARRVSSDPVLQGAIFPFVVQEVLSSILKAGDEEEEWVADWLRFCSELLGEQIATDLNDDDAEEVVARVLEAFNRTRAWAARAQETDTMPQMTYE